jgi:hypothetical protein
MLALLPPHERTADKLINNELNGIGAFHSDDVHQSHLQELDGSRTVDANNHWLQCDLMPLKHRITRALGEQNFKPRIAIAMFDGIASHVIQSTRQEIESLTPASGTEQFGLDPRRFFDNHEWLRFYQHLTTMFERYECPFDDNMHSSGVQNFPQIMYRTSMCPAGFNWLRLASLFDHPPHQLQSRVEPFYANLNKQRSNELCYLHHSAIWPPIDSDDCSSVQFHPSNADLMRWRDMGVDNVRPLTTPFSKSTRAAGQRVVHSPSNHAIKNQRFAEYVLNADEQQVFSLLLLSWLVQGRDHSFHEVKVALDSLFVEHDMHSGQHDATHPCCSYKAREDGTWLEAFRGLMRRRHMAHTTSSRDNYHSANRLRFAAFDPIELSVSNSDSPEQAIVLIPGHDAVEYDIDLFDEMFPCFPDHYVQASFVVKVAQIVLDARTEHPTATRSALIDSVMETIRALDQKDGACGLFACQQYDCVNK